jgi:hypothetical protein
LLSILGTKFLITGEPDVTGGAAGLRGKVDSRMTWCAPISTELHRLVTTAGAGLDLNSGGSFPYVSILPYRVFLGV